MWAMGQSLTPSSTCGGGAGKCARRNPSATTILTPLHPSRRLAASPPRATCPTQTAALKVSVDSLDEARLVAVRAGHPPAAGFSLPPPRHNILYAPTVSPFLADPLNPALVSAHAHALCQAGASDAPATEPEPEPEPNNLAPAPGPLKKRPGLTDSAENFFERLDTMVEGTAEPA